MVRRRECECRGGYGSEADSYEKKECDGKKIQARVKKLPSCYVAPKPQPYEKPQTYEKPSSIKLVSILIKVLVLALVPVPALVIKYCPNLNYCITLMI